MHQGTCITLFALYKCSITALPIQKKINYFKIPLIEHRKMKPLSITSRIGQA